MRNLSLVYKKMSISSYILRCMRGTGCHTLLAGVKLRVFTRRVVINICNICMEINIFCIALGIASEYLAKCTWHMSSLATCVRASQLKLIDTGKK